MVSVDVKPHVSFILESDGTAVYIVNLCIKGCSVFIFESDVRSVRGARVGGYHTFRLLSFRLILCSPESCHPT